MGKTASVVFSAEQLEFIDAFPGGVVSYRIKENTLIPISYSNGFVRLFGYDAEEFEPILQKNPLGILYAVDEERVWKAGYDSLRQSENFKYILSNMEKRRDGGLGSAAGAGCRNRRTNSV